jgi:hypothetical protein
MSESPLRQALEAAMVEHGLSMTDLTVMAPQTDPFRLDTAGNHRIGAWFGAVVRDYWPAGKMLHLRGLHYAISSGTDHPPAKPDGVVYLNNDDDWEWLATAAKASRWLGYVDWELFFDKRNAPPVVRVFARPEPEPYITLAVEMEIPAAEDIKPKLGVHDFIEVQPYKLVLVGEKSSLDDVLSPIAEAHEADLYLPTGDISDTMIYQIAKIGAEDGRPMRVVYFSDCDPSGWNMGIVISHKLRAFKILHFPDLEFEVHRAALTPDQVRRFDLPSSPLKATEKRADKWRAAMGVAQTEIDALATLRPELLDQVARETLAPFYDYDLAARVSEAYHEWVDTAIGIINDSLDSQQLSRIRAEAVEKLEAMREQVDAFNDALRLDVDDYDLPEIVIPQTEPTVGLVPEPLYDSDWSFGEAALKLIESRAYRGGGS